MSEEPGGKEAHSIRQQVRSLETPGCKEGLVLGNGSGGFTLVTRGPELQPELGPFPGQAGLWLVLRAGWSGVGEGRKGVVPTPGEAVRVLKHDAFSP